MITLRKSKDRGHSEIDWLKSNFTFSFADYYDPAHTGFRDLLVINEDYIQPSKGFDTHGHRDMEIITVVLEGAVAHKDSMGTAAVIKPGEVQRMTAGTGVRHSEFNPSDQEVLHLFQIWIQPEREGLAPGYEQKAFAPDGKKNRLKLVGSRDASEGSVTIHQDVKLFTSLLDAGAEVNYELRSGRHGWVQVARGALDLNGKRLEAGDGAAISDEKLLSIKASAAAEFILFDLA